MVRKLVWLRGDPRLYKSPGNDTGRNLKIFMHFSEFIIESSLCPIYVSIHVWPESVFHLTGVCVGTWTGELPHSAEKERKIIIP